MPVTDSVPDRLGRFLFRWRAVLGLAGFALVFLTGRGSTLTCLAALPLVGAGLGLRVWAMGYIGEAARASEVGATRCVRDGPYRWFKLGRRSLAGHPLYFGNSLLVAGMLVAFRPAFWAGVVVAAVFVVEYYLMARAEERFLVRGFGSSPAGKTVFRFERCTPEWRTVAVTLAGYGLAVGKALFG